jgi:hypothetical protein
MTDTQGDLTAPAPRANRRGGPCPPWCVTDHGRVLAGARDGEPAITFDAHCGPDHHAAAFAFASVAQGDYERDPVVHVAVGHASTHVAAGGPAAEKLAQFLESVAGLDAAGIRRLAAAVREAARDAR